MRPLRVFIVDDERDLVESLAMTMEARGFEVEKAFSGEEAIEKFRRKDFDITFMDVRLPGKNGVESFLEIRKFRPDARVIMMTGYSMEQLLDQAVENGAWGVLGKPFDLEKMFDTLDRMKPGGILIVDDDPDFIQSITDVLQENGWRIGSVNNGQDALDRIRAGGIDILILDLRLPVMNGLELYLELKRQGYSLPTIIVTAFAEDEEGAIEAFRSMSVTGVIRKPFDPRNLIDELEKISDDVKE